MRLFGFNITKAATQPVSVGTFMPWLVREPFSGAWQKNMEIESPRNLLAFSAVYACVSRIANDIAKLPIRLVEKDANGIWIERPKMPQAAVLRKPNEYQTRIHFIRAWVTSLLLNGNTYALKERDERTIVKRLHVLDPKLVTTLVSEDGGIYYQVSADRLSGIQTGFTVPASEIIHDRMITLWHPLIGVSPIYACGASATQGIKIQNNSGKFFENMSRPSGMLTAPGKITDETAARLKAQFEQGFSGGNIGRLFVAGDDLKYEAMTIPAAEAQLIEQLKWTVEDVARCFMVPLHMIGAGQNPTFNNIGALNQGYYTQTLQSLIESIELCLDEGLRLTSMPGEVGTEFDLKSLLRMDPVARADANEKAIRAGYLAPNEARLDENMPPVEGGDTPYLQQQNFSLLALSRRDSKPDPFATETAAPALPAPEPKAPAEDEDEKAMRLLDWEVKGFEQTTECVEAEYA